MHTFQATSSGRQRVRHTLATAKGAPYPHLVEQSTAAIGPPFVKTHAVLLSVIGRPQRFPKDLRHNFTERLETTAFDFQEAILRADSVRGDTRRRWLKVADGRSACLRPLLRFAYDLGQQSRHAKPVSPLRENEDLPRHLSQ